jgi:hypothetical protein
MKAISMKAMKYFLARSNLQAVVPFYGRQARPEDVPRIQAPLLLQYAELDTRINERVSRRNDGFYIPGQEVGKLGESECRNVLFARAAAACGL